MIIILKQAIVSTPDPLVSTIAVRIAISDNGNWRAWGVGGIPSDTADVQAYLNAREAALLADAQAAGSGNIIPAGKVESYKIFINRSYWLAAALQVRLEMQAASSLVTALNNVIAKMDDNSAEFATFITYKQARGLVGATVTPTDVNAMTAANRQLLLAVIMEFLGIHTAAIGYIAASELFD